MISGKGDPSPSGSEGAIQGAIPGTICPFMSSTAPLGQDSLGRFVIPKPATCFTTCALFVKHHEKHEHESPGACALTVVALVLRERLWP